MSKEVRRPEAEIDAGNPWYVEDQFRMQLGSSPFRAVVEHRWQVFERALDEWVQSRGGPPPGRLLDAGCGDGINLSFLTRLIAARRWPTTVVGADYSALRIGRARELNGSRLIQGSVVQLAFQRGSFDVVICNQVLEHVPDYRAAMSELFRVLRRGGLLIAGVPNEGSPLGRLRNGFLQRSILDSTDHVNMFTSHTLRAGLQAAGFEVARIEPEGFFVPHTTAHSLLNASRLVKRALDPVAVVFPGCAAGLIAVASRPR